MLPYSLTGCVCVALCKIVSDEPCTDKEQPMYYPVGLGSVPLIGTGLDSGLITHPEGPGIGSVDGCRVARYDVCSRVVHINGWLNYVLGQVLRGPSFRQYKSQFQNLYSVHKCCAFCTEAKIMVLHLLC
jgi:hypothetical protein